MKNYKLIFLLFSTFFLLTACPKKKREDVLTTFKKSDYNFSKYKKIDFKGLNTEIPMYFEKEYEKSYLLHQNGLSFFIPNLSVYYSIEKFEADEVEDILFQFKEGTTHLEALQTYYADLRANSLYSPKVSLMYSNYKENKLDGKYQYIEGKDKNNYLSNAMYMFATVEKNIGGKNCFFVIQLISPIEFSKYLQDDFIHLLKVTR